MRVHTERGNSQGGATKMRDFTHFLTHKSTLLSNTYKNPTNAAAILINNIIFFLNNSYNYAQGCVGSAIQYRPIHKILNNMIGRHRHSRACQ